MKKDDEIQTTGQLRELLARAAQLVIVGDLPIDRATTLHKLARNITDSLYSETKIAMFQHEVAGPQFAMGELPIGEVK